MALPKPKHPTYKMTLPSSGRTVSFRPYLVKEEKILLMAAEGDNEKQMLEATKTVLRNCILDEDFEIDDMTIFDMQYAFIQLRARSVGEKADLKVVCSECEHRNDYQLNFLDINIDIPEDLDFRIPLDNNLGVTMQFPTVKLLDNLAGMDLSNADDSIELLMACIKNIWDENTVYDPRDESQEERIAWVESLGRKDMEKMEEFTKKIPTLSEKIEFDCEECGKHNVREVGGLTDFF